MSESLVARQLAAGAWGMTAATPAQARVLRSWGVRRILLANVLVDAGSIAWLADALRADPAQEFLCYVDSIEGVSLLEKVLARRPVPRRLRVLLEVGYHGGRTGVRGLASAIDVASQVQASPQLALAGVAGFEGLMTTDDDDIASTVNGFLDQIHDVVDALHEHRLFDELEPPIVTAGGSAFFDLAVKALGPSSFPFPTHTILRSGCYITHDHGTYRRTSPWDGRRSSDADVRLRPALELVASVWSRPEPDLLIVGFGRRDVPTDAGMPTVLGRYTAAGNLIPESGASVVTVNDQHAFVRVPATSSVRIGDLLSVGISHPCGAFDRWRFLPIVTDNHDVIGGVTTTF